MSGAKTFAEVYEHRAQCEYHSGEVGYDINNFWPLKKNVQELIISGLLPVYDFLSKQDPSIVFPRNSSVYVHHFSSLSLGKIKHDVLSLRKNF